MTDQGAFEFEVIDVFAKKKLGTIKPSEKFTVLVNPTGVRFLRLNVNPTGFPASQANATLSSLDEIEVVDTGLHGWMNKNEL